MSVNKLRCPTEGCGLESYIQKFCTRDGAKLVPLIHPKCVCGDDFWPHQQFCGICGRSRADALPSSGDAPVENLCKTS